MNVEFNLDIEKTVEVVAMFLRLHSKPMYFLGLMKLLYMSDKLSLKKFNRPVIGDRYVSMDKGPVLSCVYDLIKGRTIREIPDALGLWSKYISPQNGNHQISLVLDPSDKNLSENDENIIREIYGAKGNIDRFNLVEITHQFPEWRNPNGSSIPITVEEILRSVGKSARQIELIEANISRKNHLKRILNYA